MKSSNNPSIGSLFLIFLRLGCTSFGGPIAHLGYFREEFVTQRKWFSEAIYNDLVALCQLLPGPASSQLGIAIGLAKCGYRGAVVAWLGFTLPSAILLVLFGYGLSALGNTEGAGWLHGLKIVAVAVVAQAVWGMGKTLCPDRIRITFALMGAAIALIFSNAWGQVSVIIAGGIMGWFFLRKEQNLPHANFPIKINKIVGGVALILFFILLLLLPVVEKIFHNNITSIFTGFFRAGSLVFGGGHVVLPLLQSITVPSGMISENAFLAGYGAAQAVPGPLFSFAAYLGAISKLPPNGLSGAALCLIAIYLPSFLLLIGTLPFWENLRQHKILKHAITGINATIVGLLLAALYNPVWINAIYNVKDFCFLLGIFLMLNFWKWPSWVIVILGASMGQIIY